MAMKKAEDADAVLAEDQAKAAGLAQVVAEGGDVVDRPSPRQQRRKS